MRRFFDMENPIWQGLGVIADMLILNLLTVICSLPVVTAGAAVTGPSGGGVESNQSQLS